MKFKLLFLILAIGLFACAPSTASESPAAPPTASAIPQPSNIGDLGTASIKGKVVDAETGAPIAEATVICQHDSNSFNPNETCNRTTTTNQNGEFIFENILFNQEDLIGIRIEAQGYQAVNMLRGFPAQAGIDLGEIQLSKASAETQAEIVGVSPMIANCPIFPPNNFWNTPIDSLPVHPQSDEWIESIGRNEGFHMDFGSGEWEGGPIGIPYNVVAITDVGFFVPEFYYADESDIGAYPIPPNPLIEHGSDRHLLIIDTDTCYLYEIYDASFDGANWFGGSGAMWDLNANYLRPETWTSADAAGLPILPGLARYDEIVAGEIKHALRFTAEETAGYIWPARHQTSDPQDGIPPMGARFRLKADYDISGFPPEMQIILQAMKTYGIVLADNGSNWYVSGAPDERWDNDMLHLLDVLTGNDFEAVDTSVMMLDVNSGETK